MLAAEGTVWSLHTKGPKVSAAGIIGHTAVETFNLLSVLLLLYSSFCMWHTWCHQSYPNFVWIIGICLYLQRSLQPLCLFVWLTFVLLRPLNDHRSTC